MGVAIPDAGPRLAHLLRASVLVLELLSAMRSGGARSLAETSGLQDGSDSDLRSMLLDRETIDASRLHELLHGSGRPACAALEVVIRGGKLSDSIAEIPPPPAIDNVERVEQAIAASALLAASRIIYRLRRALLSSDWDAIGTIIASARKMRVDTQQEKNENENSGLLFRNYQKRSCSQKSAISYRYDAR